MRKTTQSMYQSNLKVPVTASKVFDGSMLYKSSAAIPGKCYINLGPTKKVEGQDLAKSGPIKKNF